METFVTEEVSTYHVVACYSCGCKFGIGESLYRRVVTNAEGHVYCPACGKQMCWRESAAQREIKRLKSQLMTAETRALTAARRAEVQQQYKEHAEAKLRATKGVVTKLKKRVANGVCPCCSRHFENLQRHMTIQHPEFGKDAT